MVSFSCEACGDVLTKKKLDSHRNQCRGASFTCIDCMTHFQGTSYKSHTSCISEAQKYQGHLYREKDSKKSKADRRKSNGTGHEMIPRGAYVEDAPEGDETNAVAIVDVPPRAPTPPSAPEALPENVNVFDFLVTEDTPTGAAKKHIEASQDRLMIDRPPSRVNGHGPEDNHYAQYGFEYGHAPLQPTYERYDSWVDLNDSQRMGFVTPGPRPEREGKRSEKSEKKRKRQQIDELDLSSAKRPMSRDSMIVDPPTADRRVLHSGLTGGLSKLVTDHDFYSDRIDAGPTPISPLKRHRRGESIDERLRKETNRKSSHTSSKATSSRVAAAEDRHRSSRRRRDSSSSEEDHDRHRSSTRKAIEYHPIQRPGSVQPTAKNQLVSYSSRAELFLSFINKGPDSERGCSINKALKRYHRERGDVKEDDDKELWKSLRVKRNDRGEIVLFI